MEANPGKRIGYFPMASPTLRDAIQAKKERAGAKSVRSLLLPEVMDPLAQAMLKRALTEELPKLKQELLKEFSSSLISLAEEHVTAAAQKKMQGPQGEKGEKGDRGDIGPMPKAGVHFKLPRDGKDADENAIVSKVLKKIRMPKDGQDGRDGLDAAVDYEMLVQQTAERLKNKGIEIDDIDGLRELLDGFVARMNKASNNKGGQMRGGGDIVLAGTGVTITRDSTGRSTISASGLTELDPTSGSINSVNKAFVFASKPTYIVVDAATYRENKGWTWNAGTSTATLSIAPTYDCYGLA